MMKGTKGNIFSVPDCWERSSQDRMIDRLVDSIGDMFKDLSTGVLLTIKLLQKFATVRTEGRG